MIIHKTRSVGLTELVSSQGRFLDRLNRDLLVRGFSQAGHTQSRMDWLCNKLHPSQTDPHWVPTTSRLTNPIRWANRSHL